MANSMADYPIISNQEKIKIYMDILNRLKEIANTSTDFRHEGICYYIKKHALTIKIHQYKYTDGLIKRYFRELLERKPLNMDEDFYWFGSTCELQGIYNRINIINDILEELNLQGS